MGAAQRCFGAYFFLLIIYPQILTFYKEKVCGLSNELDEMRDTNTAFSLHLYYSSLMEELK